MATNLNEDDTQVLDNTLNQKSPSTEALSSPSFATKPDPNDLPSEDTEQIDNGNVEYNNIDELNSSVIDDSSQQVDEPTTNFTSFTFKKASQKTQQNSFLGMSRLRKAPPPPVHINKPKVDVQIKPETPTTPTTVTKDDTNENNDTNITDNVNNESNNDSKNDNVNNNNNNNNNNANEGNVNDNNTINSENVNNDDVNNENVNKSSVNGITDNSSNSNSNSILTNENDKQEDNQLASPIMTPTSPQSNSNMGQPQSVSSKGNRSRRRAMFIDPTRIMDGFDLSKCKDVPGKTPPTSPSTKSANFERSSSLKANETANENDTMSALSDTTIDPAENDESIEDDDESTVSATAVSADKKSNSKDQMFPSKIPKFMPKRMASRSIPQVKSPTISGQSMMAQQAPVSPRTPKGNNGFMVVMPEDYYDKILESKRNAVDFSGMNTINGGNEGDKEGDSSKVNEQKASQSESDTMVQIFAREIPLKVAVKIFQYLNVDDLCRCSAVNSSWNALLTNPRIWVPICFALGLPVSPRSKDPAAFKRGVQAFKQTIMENGIAEGLISGAIPSTTVRELLNSPLSHQSVDFIGPCGWSLKRGEILIKTWKRRWFMIRSGCLLYFKSRKADELPIGLFTLGQDINVNRVKPGWIKVHSSTGPLVSYKLLSDGNLERTLREYVYICTETEAEANDWIIAMEKVVNIFNSLFFAYERKPLLKVPLFGVTIESIVDRQMQEPNPPEYLVPTFIHNIIEHLSKTSLEIEGLFRISGSSQDVERLRHVLEQGADVDYSLIDPHSLAALLKLFFRELPEPLIPAPLSTWANDLLMKSGYGQDDVPDSVVDVIHDKLVDVLPISHYCLLKEIVVLFKKIVEHCSVNKMTQNNLFIVIIPTLKCAPSLIALAMDKTETLLSDNMFTTKAPPVEYKRR